MEGEREKRNKDVKGKKQEVGKMLLGCGEER